MPDPARVRDTCEAAIALSTPADGAQAVAHTTLPMAPPDGAFRVCVHRGTQQIGGTCIELSCNGARILLDLGLPLDAGDTDPATLLPPITGLRVASAGKVASRLSASSTFMFIRAARPSSAT